MREFLKFIGALLGGVVGVLLAAVWAAVLVLAGPGGKDRRADHGGGGALLL